MVEKASYELVRRIDDVEIRQYDELILAVVEGYIGDTGFGLLFDYISGNNTSHEKISMTAPVIRSEKIPMTAPVITKKNYMAFVLPSSYSLDTTPSPNNDTVRIKKKKKSVFAVLRFSGKVTEKQVEEYIHRLFLILQKEKIQIKDGPLLMRYNSPFAPGFIRRNEVAFEIDESQ